MGIITLATQNLYISYKNKQNTIHSIIENGNIAIENGKLTVLVGINGIGKTSLLKVLAGLHTNFTGNITLFNKNIHSYTLAEKAKYISVVFHEKFYPPILTVKEIVEIGRQPYTDWTGKLQEIDEQIVANALKITEIQHLANRYIDTLSDGQLQKMWIARAVAQAGNIMLLDEPTAHLDICSKAEIWNLLKNIAKNEQKAILLTSHDIDFSLQLADCILLIDQKQLLSFSPKELIQSNLLDKIFASPYFTFKNGILQLCST
jgi:iron complex transport system ATP-binding protein